MLTGDQPALLFEISPVFLGLGVLLLAPALGLEGSRRWFVLALGFASALAGTIAAITEWTGEVLGPAIAVATLAAVVGAVVGGWRPRADPRKCALVVVGACVVPALLIGGILSEIDERLLEVGLLAYAAAWGLAGYRLLGPGPGSAWRGAAPCGHRQTGRRGARGRARRPT